MLSWSQQHPIFGFDSTKFCPTVSELVYLAQIAGHFADWFAWQQGAKRSLLYHFALSQGPRVVFKRISINITVLLQKVLEFFGSVLVE